jgi:hypothetical protein
MNRVSKQQKFISLLGVICFLFILSSYAEAKPPNFLLVMADDMGWTDIGSFGSEIDTYYRVQVTPEIQVGPTFQVIFDPVRNPEEDTVYVWGIRSRIEF